MEYTRVTEILNPFSGYGKINPVILDKAKIRGTIVHEQINSFIETGILDFESEYQGYLDSFKMFWDLEPRSILMNEKRLYNDEYMISGQCDLILETEKDRILVDWKTSTSENRTWCLQGSAYSFLAQDEYGPITKILFVKLDKNGKQPFIYQYKQDHNLGEFLNLVKIYNNYFKGVTNETMETELL